MAKRVVIALGGNAILKPNQPATVETQLANIQLSAEQIAKIEKLDHQIVVTHGNGRKSAIFYDKMKKPKKSCRLFH